MPELTDADSFVQHLREAIKSKTRWVFVADNEASHLHMVALAFALYLRWEKVGVDAKSLLHYGCCEFAATDTFQRGALSLLTIPRSAFDADDVNDFFAMTSWDPANPTGGNWDVIVLCDKDPVRLEGVVAFLRGVVKGKAYPLNVEDN
jgi:hypothetical protein